jgi:hypothetical protein
MLKIFNLTFYVGIFTSVFSGAGLTLGIIDQNMAALYGVLGIIGTSIGYAGKYYLNRKLQMENGQYYKQMKARAEKREEKKKKRS